MGHRPKTGERRKIRQPLAIDRLPQEVRDRIVALRAEGRGWEQIEEMSVEFAGRRLPHTTLHRWYDIRVEQELKAAMEEREHAQRWVNAFAGQGVPQLSEAVRNALGESVFLLKQAADSKDKARFEAALLELGHLLVKFDKIAVDKEKVEIERAKLEAIQQKFEKATNEAAKQLGKGKALTVDDINRIRERTFGLPPVQR